jgi:hypothetical protein
VDGRHDPDPAAYSWPVDLGRLFQRRHPQRHRQRAAQTILNNCVDQAVSVASNPNCAAITRDPTTKAVTSVSAVNLNIGRLLTDGIDFNVNYGWNLSAIAASLPGRITLNLTGTYLSRLRYFTDANDPSSVTRQDGVLGNPNWSMLGSATYSLPRFSITWQARYLGSQWITYYRALRPAASTCRSPA